MSINKYYFWLGLFGLFFLIAAVLYSPSLSGPWQYDDYAQILDEKVLTGRSLPRLLSSTFRFTAHPDGWTGTRDLVRASFLMNWQWWGKEPAGYRWVNLLIHVVNATLVTSLIYLLLKIKNFKLKIEISILSGLIFLVHPLNSQAVAYVAQRFTSMATMFYLGTIVSWLLFLKSRSHYSLLFTSYFLALLAFNSKEITVTLPITLALVTKILNTELKILNDKQGESRRPYSVFSIRYSVLLLIPFFFLSLKLPSQILSSSFGSTISMDKVAEVTADSFALKQKAVDLTRHDYFLTQINVVGTYLRLAVLPVKQTLDYDYPLTTRLDVKTVLKGGFHLGLIAAGIWFLFGSRFSVLGYQFIVNKFSVSRSRTDELKTGRHETENGKPKTDDWRLVGFGILWFYLTLLPESSVVPIADLIYEHRTYLPMVGLIIAMAGAIAQIQNSKFKIQNSLFYFLLITLYSLLSVATLGRAWVWGNEVRLWADIYEEAPNKPRANKNYGVVLAAAGKYEQGVKRLARAVELEPENADYWSNFGTAYLRWGKYEESAGKFLKAFDLFSAQKGISDLSNLSSLSNLNEKDRHQAAQYMNDYGVSMVQLQRGDEALAGFEKALTIDPTLYAAWLGLGAAYNLKGDSEMAIKVFSQTVKDFPDQPDAYNNLAVMYKKTGRMEDHDRILRAAPKSP
ncbi:tetratricopeptide repeat protein [Candidatus Collierbacteria bacterium]|nr:tetratricopeptide repeat protein [Candidatus Collierbacteria bacterium]